jgi:hypothetical protein
MAPTSEIGDRRAGTSVGILRLGAFDVVVMNTSAVSTTLHLEQASFCRTTFQSG